MRTLAHNQIFLLLILFVFIGTANGQVEKTKEVHKTFKTNNSTLLRIDNRYGEVHIETWAKDEVKLDIIVTIKKRSEARADEILNNIDFDISESSSVVSIETKINGSINTGKSDNFSIDYKVFMPKANPLNVKNKYGSFYLADFDGRLELEIKYGNMKVRNVKGKSFIALGYGSGEIESLNNGELEISYSNMTIERMGEMEVYSKYSKLEFNKIGKMYIENKYGNVNVGEAVSIEGDIKYGGMRVAKLSKKLLLECKYGSGVNVDWISKDFEMVRLRSGYASSRLIFEKGFTARFDGNFRYCNLRYPEGDFDFSEIHESSNQSEYHGVMGKGTPKSQISINSEYGDVKIDFDY